MIESTGTEGDRSTDEDTELIQLLAGLKGGECELAASMPAAVSEDSSLQVQGRRMKQPASMAATGTGPLTQNRTLRIDVEVLNRMMNLVANWS